MSKSCWRPGIYDEESALGTIFSHGEVRGPLERGGPPALRGLRGPLLRHWLYSVWLFPDAVHHRKKKQAKKGLCQDYCWWLRHSSGTCMRDGV